MAFANPEILFFLLLSAIPIVIHLFNFKRYRRFYFTNLRFLTNIKNETKKQSTIKKYLILATRILIITALVLAFAQPYFSNKKGNIDLMKKNCVSIYVDNSFSMEGEVFEGTALEAAKKTARQIIDKYDIADCFQIVTNEFHGYQQRSYNKTEAMDMVDEIEISPYTRQIDKIVERQEFVLNAANSCNRISYIISDFQKGMVTNRDFVFDSLIDYNLIRINANRVSNIYIDSCWFSSPVHNLFNTANLNVRIVNNSNDKREQMPIKLVVNGEQRAISNFDVEPNSTVEVTIPYNERKSGVKSCYVEISDYPIVYDDRLYFTYNVMDRFNVISITGSTHNKYLDAAFAQDSSFNYISFSAKKGIDYERLNNSDVVILEGANLTSGMIVELNKFVINGGTLIVFPSKDMDVISYNELLRSVGAGQYEHNEVLPNMISKDNKITDISFDSQIYKNVFNSKPEKMDLPLVNSWYRILTTSQSPGETLLKMISGDVFLVGFNENVYLFSTPLSSDFSTFPIHSIFVPTIFNIAINSITQNNIYQVYGSDNIHNITDGRLVNSKDVIRLVSNDLKMEFIPHQSDVMGKKSISFTDIEIPAGNYVIKYGDDIIDGVSMNYDRKESVLDFYSDNELNSINNNNITLQSGIRTQDGTSIANENDLSLLIILVILALLLLLSESLIIRFMK